jgi:hypothetical protein
MDTFENQTELLIKRSVNSTPKQAEFFNAILSKLYTRLLFGGGVGGGKTVGALLILYALCKIFPGSRWAVVRKDRPTLKRATIPSFWKSCPMPFFHPDRYNRSDMIAVASNGSRIEFIPESYAEDPELHRFDGLEVNGFLLEEAEELNVNTYVKAIERSGRWIINPMPLPYIILTCNPHQGFLKELFYTPYSKGELKPPFHFTRALAGDNPYHSKEYVKNLDEIKRHSPNQYRRLVEGSWEADDDSQQLISWESLFISEHPLDIPSDFNKDLIHASLGIDVGRHGKDSSAWVVMRGCEQFGYNIERTLKKGKTDQNEVLDITKNLIIEHDIPHERCWLDVVGLGGGVYDFLVNQGYFIQEVVGGAVPVEQVSDCGFKFYNFNSQLGWNAKLLFESGKIGGLTNEELRADIACQGYGVQGERSIRLWGKDKIKEKIHRSPDLGDAFKYALWGQIFDTISPLPGFLMV